MPNSTVKVNFIANDNGRIEIPVDSDCLSMTFSINNQFSAVVIKGNKKKLIVATDLSTLISMICEYEHDGYMLVTLFSKDKMYPSILSTLNKTEG